MIESITSVPLLIESSLKICSKNFEKIGFPYIGYALIGPSQTTGFFSFPQWKKVYIDDKNSILDPYTKLAMMNTLKFFVWENVPCNKKEREICELRKELCHVHNGITFTHRRGDYKEIFALATDSKNLNLHEKLLDNVALNEILAIQQQMFFFHKKAHEK